MSAGFVRLMLKNPPQSGNGCVGIFHIFGLSKKDLCKSILFPHENTVPPPLRRW